LGCTAGARDIFLFLLVLDDLQGPLRRPSLWFLSALVLCSLAALILTSSFRTPLLAGAQFGGSVWTAMFPPQRIVTIDHRVQFRVGVGRTHAIFFQYTRLSPTGDSAWNLNLK
jgi:hypothetical protein